MRKTLPILALALFAGAFLLLRLPSGSSHESAIDATIAPIGINEPERDADLVPIAGTEARDEVESDPSPEPPPEEGEFTEEFEVSSSDAAPAHRPWMLELRVDAPVEPGEMPEPAEVRVRARLDGDPFAIGDGITASCAVGQVTSIDIGSFRTGAQEPAMLSLTATHPVFSCEPMNVELIAEHLAPGEARPPVEASLQLERAMVIHGRVTQESKGRQVTPSGPTRIGAWKSRGGQPVEGSPLVTGGLDGEGAYSIRVPEPGDYFVAAMQPSTLPDGESCTVTEAASTVALRTLVLSAADSITGQFVAGKGPPSGRVQYAVSRELNGPTLEFGEHLGPGSSADFVWSQGRLLPAKKTGLAESDGRFAVEGLGAGPHELRVIGFAGARMRSEPRYWNVQVPASNLRFDLGLASVTVVLVPHPRQPFPNGMKLFLTRPQGTELGNEEEEIRVDFVDDATFSSGEESVEFFFTPQAAVRVRLAVKGADDVVRDFISPRSGESLEVSMNLPLGEAVSYGSLRIKLTGNVPPDGTSFVVHANQVEKNSTPDEFRKTSDDHAHVTESANGELVISEVPVGHTRLAVYPATWVGHRASHHLDTIADVTVEEGLETTVTLDLVLGGRLRVAKPNGAGGYHSEKCTIRRPGGDPIPVQFIAYAANGGGAWGSDDSLLGLAPSLVMPNLEPGSYEVQVGDDTQIVAVRAGEIIDVLFE